MSAEARLRRPEDLMENVLQKAVDHLPQGCKGDTAGEVFHVFAEFCSHQLQDPDGMADLDRIRTLRAQKAEEVHTLGVMIKQSQSRERESLKSHQKRARLWLELDNTEYTRLEKNRLTLLQQSLRNYLQSLTASDRFDEDALRFSALWLEHHDEPGANDIVGQYLPSVPSHKFAALINQWCSRLAAEHVPFQTLLADLIVRICVEHPYHGMYQIFASSKTKAGKDKIALSRHAAANQIVDELKRTESVAALWTHLHNTNVDFVRFASEKLQQKTGSRVALESLDSGRRLASLKVRVPPPTMTLDLRPDGDYREVPHIVKFQSEFTLASGISMPKIIAVQASDGQKYKQLFKAGNDDLRQDAIMEQVFGAVSSLLRRQRATRQRNLQIRTYKVLPLTATAGVIEFVRHTIPLHDFLLPAHARHFPKDWKPNVCRRQIQDVQTASPAVRVRAFRKVCEHFHPVLHFFFTQHFRSPDVWFARRLAYSRTTASISILGHILGLGDRHGHNILLDEQTGEVVHIDLGIAFEQGRILPVPELVPFRLTRDVVAGMGITGVEGVFRRCCEFTLEALRTESQSIMTILDVLRYDPLYSWSMSPIRLKRLQDAQLENSDLPAEFAIKSKGGEAGEADRALLVVHKKLSKTLSVQATVNELIAAATDEKNLALLFCGWAAYA